MHSLLFLALALVVAAIAGCGSGDGESNLEVTSKAITGSGVATESTTGSGVANESTAGSGVTSEATATGAGTSKPLTEAQYVERGDAICRKMGEQMRKEIESAIRLSGLEDESAATKELREEISEDTELPSLQKEAEALRALEPGADWSMRIGILDAFEEAVALGEKTPSLLLHPGQPPFSEVSRELEHYGFKICGSDF